MAVTLLSYVPGSQKKRSLFEMLYFNTMAVIFAVIC